MYCIQRNIYVLISTVAGARAPCQGEHIVQVSGGNASAEPRHIYIYIYIYIYNIYIYIRIQ